MPMYQIYVERIGQQPRLMMSSYTDLSMAINLYAHHVKIEGLEYPQTVTGPWREDYVGKRVIARCYLATSATQVALVAIGEPNG